MNIAAWSNSTKRWAEAGNSKIVGQSSRTVLSEHGFAPTTTCELVWDKRRYPPKAVLGVAYEFDTGQQPGFGDFEGGKTGAVRVLGKLGFSIEKKLKK